MTVAGGRLVTPVAHSPAEGYLALEVDANGFLKITSVLPGYLPVSSHGYVAGGWYKNSIQFGYSDTVLKVIDNLAIAAGNTTQNLAAVPAGKIWVITNFQFIYIGTSPTAVQIAIVSGGNVARIYRQVSPTSGVGYDRQGWWVMKEGDYAQMQVMGGTANDDIYFHSYGFAVDIAL